MKKYTKQKNEPAVFQSQTKRSTQSTLRIFLF